MSWDIWSCRKWEYGFFEAFLGKKADMWCAFISDWLCGWLPTQYSSAVRQALSSWEKKVSHTFHHSSQAVWSLYSLSLHVFLDGLNSTSPINVRGAMLHRRSREEQQWTIVALVNKTLGGAITTSMASHYTFLARKSFHSGITQVSWLCVRSRYTTRATTAKTRMKKLNSFFRASGYMNPYTLPGRFNPYTIYVCLCFSFLPLLNSWLPLFTLYIIGSWGSKRFHKPCPSEQRAFTWITRSHRIICARCKRTGNKDKCYPVQHRVTPCLHKLTSSFDPTLWFGCGIRV